jgi:DNA-directed RNA polymerase subunit RPC12/RpoP
MSVFWTAISAISTISGNFVTRCPRCSAKMKREEKHEQAYTKTKSSRGGLRSAARTGGMRYAGRTVQIVPVFDVCLECGHKVRRKNLQLG